MIELAYSTPSFNSGITLMSYWHHIGYLPSPMTIDRRVLLEELYAHHLVHTLQSE